MCIKGGEILSDDADSKSRKISASNLANRSSRELVDLWQSGSQDAARLLLTRYEVRLIALVASRIHRKYRDRITPEDIVQSALGSFFRATRASTTLSMKFVNTSSAWNILATFARRKLSRALERVAAVKRGGGRARISLDDVEPDFRSIPSVSEADDLLAEIRSFLDSEQSELLELLLGNATQREIAKQFDVDERTIRRRITAIQNIVKRQLDPVVDERTESHHDSAIETLDLPNILYREFVLGNLVGSGALGKVYRARLQSNGQVVAVKFMHRHLWTDPTSRISFLREIDHASKINHPGVLKYFGWGQSPHGGPYLVCEYIDGQPLTHLGPSDWSVSLRWLAQICEAVEAMHRAGVVHGDLNPNNILLDDKDRMIITDFGFSTLAQQAYVEGVATDPFAAPGGTLGFAAPEQISSAFGSISFATDIYAIGGIAFYLLTGCSPHDRNLVLDTVTDQDVCFPNITGVLGELKLLEVAKAALRKGVECRPRSAGELRSLLAD